jgi:transposase
MPKGAKETVKLLAAHLEGLDRSIDATEERIAEANAESRVSLLLDQIPGIGPLIASAIAASVPNPSVFKSGRDFAAWLGPHSKTAIERRQGEARRHHQAGQSVPPKNARGRVHVGAARGG